MTAQSQIDIVVNAIGAAGEAMAGSMLSIGLGLAVALLTIKVAWLGLQVSMGSKSGNEGLMELLITLGIGGTIISAFLPGVGWYSAFIGILRGGFDAIATTLTTALGDPAAFNTNRLSGLTSPLFTAMSLLFTAMGNMWSELKPSLATITSGSIFVDTANVLLISIFCIGVLFLMCLALVVAIIAFLLATLAFAVGVAFGPILIPFYLLKPLEDMLLHWFMFLVSAATNQIMLLVLMTIATGAVVGVTTNAVGLLKGPLVVSALSLTPFFILLLVAVLILMMVIKAEALTNALLPGRGSFGLAGFTAAVRGAGKVLSGAGAAASTARAGANKTLSGARATTNAIGSTALQASQQSRQTGKGLGASAVSVVNSRIAQAISGKGAPGPAPDVGSKVPTSMKMPINGAAEKMKAAKAQTSQRRGNTK